MMSKQEIKVVRVMKNKNLCKPIYNPEHKDESLIWYLKRLSKTINLIQDSKDIDMLMALTTLLIDRIEELWHEEMKEHFKMKINNLEEDERWKRIETFVDPSTTLIRSAGS